MSEPFSMSAFRVILSIVMVRSLGCVWLFATRANLDSDHDNSPRRRRCGHPGEKGKGRRSPAGLRPPSAQRPTPLLHHVRGRQRQRTYFGQRREGSAAELTALHRAHREMEATFASDTTRLYGRRVLRTGFHRPCKRRGRCASFDAFTPGFQRNPSTRLVRLQRFHPDRVPTRWGANIFHPTE